MQTEVARQLSKLSHLEDRVASNLRGNRRLLQGWLPGTRELAVVHLGTMQGWEAWTGIKGGRQGWAATIGTKQDRKEEWEAVIGSSARQYGQAARIGSKDRQQG